MDYANQNGIIAQGTCPIVSSYAIILIINNFKQFSLDRQLT